MMAQKKPLGATVVPFEVQETNPDRPCGAVKSRYRSRILMSSIVLNIKFDEDRADENGDMESWMKRMESLLRAIRYGAAVVLGVVATLLLIGVVATWGDPSPSDPKGGTSPASVILLLLDLSMAYVAWKVWPKKPRLEAPTNPLGDGAPADGIGIPPREEPSRFKPVSAFDDIPQDPEPQDDIPLARHSPVERSRPGNHGIDFSRLVDSRSVSGRYSMEYMDSNGNITDREVDLKKVYIKAGTIYFAAYCHLRNSIKTFRADRVVALEDLDNGMSFDRDIELVFAGMLLRG